LSVPPESIRNPGRLANQIKRQGNQGAGHGFDAVRPPELMPNRLYRRLVKIETQRHSGMFFLDELQQGTKRSAFARLDFNRHNRKISPEPVDFQFSIFMKRFTRARSPITISRLSL